MYKLCDLNELPNHDSKGFTLGQHSLFVVRKDNQVFAYHDNCPHLGIQLAWNPDKFLNYEKELIQCSTHGALFVIETGKCVAGPCSGDTLKPIKLTIEDSTVFIDLHIIDEHR